MTWLRVKGLTFSAPEMGHDEIDVVTRRAPGRPLAIPWRGRDRVMGGSACLTVSGPSKGRLGAFLTFL